MDLILKNHKMKKLTLITAIIMLAGMAFGQYWHLAGSHIQDYESGGDPTVEHGAENGGFIKSTSPEIEGFGTLMTSTKPDKYIAKKIRMSAFVKTEKVEGWVGLWVRVDEGQYSVSFDNMQDRPITGTSDWEEYEIILDVPKGSTGISYGIILAGTGEAWIDGLELEAIE